MAVRRKSTRTKSTMIDRAHGVSRSMPRPASSSTASGKAASPKSAAAAPKKAAPAKRSSTTARRSAPKRKAAPVVVDHSLDLIPGERVWILDEVPFGVRLPGSSYDKARKQTVYLGASLPPELSPYRSKDYSLARWVEDEINGSPAPVGTAQPMVPRADQREDIATIIRSIDAGHRGFFLTSQTGTGKTIVSVHAALHAAASRGSSANILVIANRPAALCIPDFRRTIQAVGDGGHRWLVTTVDRVHSADALGVEWDVVIVDEAHGFRATDTRRSKALRSVTKARNATKAPFVLNMTATPAHNPTELTYLAPLLAQHHREKPADWVADHFADALARHGFHLPKGRYGRQWSEDPAERAADVTLLRSWLESGVPKTLYRAAPWGPAPLEVATTDLDPARRAQYETDWAQFRQEIEAARSAGRGDKGRAAVLRWRQKALVLRLPEIAEWALAQLELDQQVVLYTDFVGVGAEPLADLLASKKAGVARLYGTGIDHARELARFASGAAPIAVTTMSASINLQAGAVGPDGKTATTAPRVGAMTAPIYSGLKGRQVIGRTHRDGQVSPWLVMAAADSVEEDIARTMISRFAASDGLAGADTTALKEVAEMIGADWLDLSKDEEA